VHSVHVYMRPRHIGNPPPGKLVIELKFVIEVTSTLNNCGGPTEMVHILPREVNPALFIYTPVEKQQQFQ